MAGAPEKISDTEVLRTLRETPGIVASSGEIAGELPVVQKTVEKRLNDLYTRGLVDRKEIGRAYAWWLTDEGRSHLETDSEMHEGRGSE